MLLRCLSIAVLTLLYNHDVLYLLLVEQNSAAIKTRLYRCRV